MYKVIKTSQLQHFDNTRTWKWVIWWVGLFNAHVHCCWTEKWRDDHNEKIIKKKGTQWDIQVWQSRRRVSRRKAQQGSSIPPVKTSRSWIILRAADSFGPLTILISILGCCDSHLSQPRRWITWAQTSEFSYFSARCANWFVWGLWRSTSASSDLLGERKQAAKTFFILCTLVTSVANINLPLLSVHVNVLSVTHDAFATAWERINNSFFQAVRMVSGSEGENHKSETKAHPAGTGPTPAIASFSYFTTTADRIAHVWYPLSSSFVCDREGGMNGAWDVTCVCFRRSRLDF